MPGPLILEQGVLRLLIPRRHQATSLCLLTWLLLHWASGLQGSYHFPLRHLQAFTGSLSSPLYFLQGSGHRDVGLFSQVTLRSMLSAPGTHIICTLWSYTMLAQGISSWLLYSRCQAAHRYKSLLLHSKRTWLFCHLHPNPRLSPGQKLQDPFVGKGSD